MALLNTCHLATLTRWGGVERMLADLLLHTPQQQVHHTLLTTSSDPTILQSIQQQGITWYQPTGRFRYDARKFGQMSRWMRKNQIHVVHSYNAFANAWAYISTMLAGTPVLITGEHGTIWNSRPPLAWLDRLAHRRAHLVVANSQASAKLLELKYSIDPNKIRVVRNAVLDTPTVDANHVREQLGIAQQALVVGSVGRLDTPKDYTTLIEAAAVVQKTRRDVVFVLVGGGPLEKELRAHVAAHGLQDRFLLTGQRADARTLMQAFDIFVSTSIRETFGNVFIEAGLCGNPIIAPNVDGIPEAVLNHETGILVEPTLPIRQVQAPGAAKVPKRVLRDGQLCLPKALDPQILAQTILNLLANQELRLLYGQQGKKRAQELFSIDRYIHELETIYLEVGGKS